jgi:hypothetical protein
MDLTMTREAEISTNPGRRREVTRTVPPCRRSFLSYDAYQV